MVCSMYEVKRYRGEFDGESATPPDNTFDESQGYYVGFRLLVEDGTLYVCEDATTGAAVWKLDDKEDSHILSQIGSVGQLITRYCNQVFTGSNPDYCISPGEVVFLGNRMTCAEANYIDKFFAGDTLVIYGSRRNDGYYTAETVYATYIEMTTDFPVDMTDTSEIFTGNVVWPQAVREIGARMVEYDVYRRNESPGLASESIGTYSSQKEETDLFGITYPNSVVAGLSSFKRPRIADSSNLVYLSYQYR